MRLPDSPLLPQQPESEYDKALNKQLYALLRQISAKVNNLADGDISAIDNAATSAPTTGTWKQGDFIRNSTPTEAGTALSKYVVTGFICVASGTPGTWVQTRSLTGN